MAMVHHQRQNIHILTPALVLLAGMALRLYRLGAQSLWYDETVSAVLARKSVPELIAHTARDIHPPGYYLLLHFWVAVTGHSEFALAFFSLGCGLLLVAAVYRLGRTCFNRSTGLWAAALTAFSPYNLWYSQEVRMYTLGALLGVAAIYGLWQGFRRKKPSAWGLYIFCAALGLYTLYYFAFLLAALNLFALGAILLDGAWRKSLKPWLIANVAVVLIYLPWLGVAWRQAVTPPVPPWRSEVPPAKIALEGWSALSLGESVAPGEWWPLLLLTLALFGLGIFTRPLSRSKILFPWLVLGPAILIILPNFIPGASPLYHPRYLFTYSPAFYLMVGAGLAWLWQRQKPIAAGCGLALAVAAAFSIGQFHTQPQLAADDLRGAAAFIEEKWRPGDVILVNAGYTYTALAWYLTEPAVYRRLTAYRPPVDPAQMLILQTGSIGGPATLGWGNPQSDFYATTPAETEAALASLSQTSPRLWVLRAYDTVTDPDGLIRRRLPENMIQVEDHRVSGPSSFKVLGFLNRQTPAPPQAMAVNFGDKIDLVGLDLPAGDYRPGRPVDVAVWLEARANLAADPPYALSVKVWDEQGNAIAQADEWPAGGLYFSPAWPVGSVIRHPVRLVLPENIAPGEYRLSLQLYRSDNGQALEITGANETIATLGQIIVK